MTMRAFGPGPCGVLKATLEKWERDINEAVAKASEAGAGISPPPSYALDPSYLDKRVLAAGLPVRRGRVLGWSPERGPRGSYRVQLADAQVWAEYPGVGFVLGDDVGVYLDGLGAAWHASSRGVDDMLRDHDERMKRARDVVGEIGDAFRALGWDVDGTQASVKTARPAVFAAWDRKAVALSTGDDPRWGVTISRDIDAAARADIRGFVQRIVFDTADKLNAKMQDAELARSILGPLAAAHVVKNIWKKHVDASLERAHELGMPRAPSSEALAEIGRALDAAGPPPRSPQERCSFTALPIGHALADSTPNTDGTHSVAFALGGAQKREAPDAGMVRCGRCGGPSGYLGIRCERVGGCRTAEERVAAMEPDEVSRRTWAHIDGFTLGEMAQRRGTLSEGERVWFAHGHGAAKERVFGAGPTRDLAIAAWREEMVRRERAKDGRS